MRALGPDLGDYGDFSALNPCYFNLDNSSVGAGSLAELGVYGQTADCAGYANAANAPWSCGDPVSYQGYDYATVHSATSAGSQKTSDTRTINGDAFLRTKRFRMVIPGTGAVAVYGKEVPCNSTSVPGDALMSVVTE